MTTIAIQLHPAMNTQQTNANRHQILSRPRPGTMKDYGRFATMIANMFQSEMMKSRNESEESLVRLVYLHRVKEVIRLYPHPNLRPRGYEDVENPANIERMLSGTKTLAALIRGLIIQQFPEIPLMHRFESGATLEAELDSLIDRTIETYVPTYTTTYGSPDANRQIAA